MKNTFIKMLMALVLTVSFTAYGKSVSDTHVENTTITKSYLEFNNAMQKL